MTLGNLYLVCLAGLVCTSTKNGGPLGGPLALFANKHYLL